jgi:hemolysin activation/secretion protein
VIRGAGSFASGPLPLFEQALLGGAGSVRGYRPGAFAGDNISLLSAELRVPITSPLSLGRVGVKAFADAGAAYPHGGALADQRVERGYGGGLFFNATVFSAGIDVARSRSGDTRAHVSLGVRIGS